MMSILTIMIMMMMVMMILMMIPMMILMMILMMVGAGTEDRSREEPYTFPLSRSPPRGGGAYKFLRFGSRLVFP